jgi:type I restriction enzyme S subunit
MAMVKGPGVVIGRSGSLGGGQFVEGDFWPLNTTLWVKDFKGNDPRFCYYLLKSLDLAHFNAGSGVPTLNRNHIHPLPVKVPGDLAEQRAIAHILGTLDDKIELNRRMSETLEQMARAIFKAWFVDFEPVRAKMEGRWRRGESLPGLPAHLYELFPDRLVDSELGEIPEGWRVGCVEDLCSSIENGGTPKRMDPRYWGGRIPWFKSGELTDGPLLDSEEKITNDGLAESSCKIWPPGTILIALYASPTVGRLGILEVPAAANQACSALLPSPDYGFAFLFYALLLTRERLQQIAVGAAQQNISQKVVRTHRIIIPPKQAALCFHKLVEDSYRRRVSLANESRTLAALRDALLPKLISGELRLGDAERFLKERRL